VNDVDSGEIVGEGSKSISVKFFAYADSNQMPIRRMVVDWGDDWVNISGSADSMPWPTGSQSGSDASDNFYKNHRGINSTFHTEECSDSATEFGKNPQACSTGYVNFTHDYVCTKSRVDQLRAAERESCPTDEDDRLIYSPCLEDGACVFQPRVHVMDNWGWCTGYCDAGTDNTEECFTGIADDGFTPIEECNIEFCPSEGSTGTCNDENDTINPWLNFDGTIIIEPK
jgi:hypothetical protein